MLLRLRYKPISNFLACALTDIIKHPLNWLKITKPRATVQAESGNNPYASCFRFFSFPNPEFVLFLDNATFFDAGLLTCELAQVVKLGTTYLTVLVDGNGVDERRLDGEDTLNTDVFAHFANGETLLRAFAGDADNHTAVLLDTLLVTFFDAVSHSDGVAGAKFGMLLAGSESFFGNFNQIHCSK